MRVVKSISLYFVCPVLLLGLGFGFGFGAACFFYPNGLNRTYQDTSHRDSSGGADKSYFRILDKLYPGISDKGGMPTEQMLVSEDFGMAESSSGDADSEGVDAEISGALTVQTRRETLCVDTEYVLIETDLIKRNAVETTRKLPPQYIGMGREQFLDAMEVYEKSPPLSELERGFVGLEVQRFSRERVIVQMNYRYVQPGDGFYLAVKNHEVIVYLDDKETVYMDTGIDLDCIPEAMQLDIIQMMYVPDEGSLYSFLETYSS